MPTPKPGEKQSDYMRRAIHVIKDEEPNSSLMYRVMKAKGMWQEWKKKHGGAPAKKEG